MEFVIISDTHGLHRQLSLPSGDIIIHAGDFCNFGNEEHLKDFLNWYVEIDFKYKILIGGNHDYFAAEEPDRFDALVSDDIVYLNDSGIKINGLKLWGSPVVPDLVGMAFGKTRGEQMNESWNLIPNNIDVLITHTPPYGILDKSSSGKSLGCKNLLKKLYLLEPKVHIFGHIHASYGKTKINNTLYVNASNYDSKKGLVNSPIKFDLNSNTAFSFK